MKHPWTALRGVIPQMIRTDHLKVDDVCFWLGNESTLWKVVRVSSNRTDVVDVLDDEPASTSNMDAPVIVLRQPQVDVILADKALAT